MKVGLDLIKPFEAEAAEIAGTEYEVMACFCQDPKTGLIDISPTKRYIPEKGYTMLPPCPEDKKTIGIIHSHRTQINHLSYSDISNRDIQKSSLACVTADDGAGKQQTRCYILNRTSKQPGTINEYYDTYHDFNKAAASFLLDAVGDWIIGEMII